VVGDDDGRYVVPTDAGIATEAASTGYRKFLDTSTAQYTAPTGATAHCEYDAVGGAIAEPRYAAPEPAMPEYATATGEPSYSLFQSVGLGTDLSSA
jgi:hypothetical protein